MAELMDVATPVVEPEDMTDDDRLPGRRDGVAGLAAYTLGKLKAYLLAGGATLPPGGTTGQVLTKVSDVDGDAGWSDPTGGGGEAISGVYRFGAFFTTTPGADEVLMSHVATDPFTLPADLAGSQFVVGTNPGSTIAFSLAVNGVEIGTVEVTSGGVVTFDAPETEIETGDVIDLIAPADSDGIADTRWTFRATIAGSGLGGVTGGAWALVDEIVISAPVANVDVPDLADYEDIVILGTALTASASGVRTITVSTDNGATFFNTSGNYVTIGSDGNLTNEDVLTYETGSGTTGATLFVEMFNKNSAWRIGRSALRTARFVGDAVNPINAIRVASTGGNLTGGTIRVWGRKPVESTGAGGGGGGYAPPDFSAFVNQEWNSAAPLVLDSYRDAAIPVWQSNVGQAALYETIPAGDFEVWWHVRMQVASTNPSIPFVGVWDSSDSDALALCVYYETDSPQVRLFNIDTAGYIADTKVRPSVLECFFRITRTGTTLDSFVSQDGVNWCPYRSDANPFTADRAGFGFHNEDSPASLAILDYYRSW